MANSNSTSTLSALLLLPPPPQPPSPATLAAAYRLPLDAALRRLKRLAARSSTRASCDIALPFPGYTLGQGQHTFSGCEENVLHSIQDLLLNTYALIYSLLECNEHSQQELLSGDTSLLDKSNINRVDIRIILLGYDQGFNYDFLVRPARAIPSCIVDLSILALCDKKWSHLYVTEGEPGERLYRQFRALVNGSLSARVGGTWEVERVPGGMSFNMRQKSQILSGVTAPPVPDAHALATESAGQRVLVIGREAEQNEKSVNPVLEDLNQKLQLTIGLLLAEFYGSASPSEYPNPDDESDQAPPLPSNPAALEVTQFFQSIVDWRIAGDRFSKTQPARSMLRFYSNVDGSFTINPWKMIYVTDAPKQLKRILGGNEEDGDGHLEYTVVSGASQNDSLVNLLQPWNDKCRMVVCEDLAASIESDELHQADTLCKN
ncbi:hypothetical protein I7I51_00740 [Histoplasma capsulatum]|uniref:Uncharacterized protein n=1 Tax=Ajellomyces capsulatus TaxID=5037 RepID=A0A8A1MCM9_AJECA|nr:predicted protein [Histoplasma mississippiense (nom. inval.)]EDN09076.1 predicted protein [Histoplasma mississippiense (nom. inval.)]QSS63681.1 hypothetical protein I7I51_00740 [Histoplasma capsulatum]